MPLNRSQDNEITGAPGSLVPPRRNTFATAEKMSSPSGRGPTLMEAGVSLVFEKGTVMHMPK